MNYLDIKFMRMSIKEAKKSISENEKPHPLVGAVIVKNGKIIAKGYRGKISKGDHAEFTILEKEIPDKDLTGATLYTTLEPCTTRSREKIPCTNRIINRRIGRVVIGILDPYPPIKGNGKRLLEDNHIKVELYPKNLQEEIKKINKKYINYIKKIVEKRWDHVFSELDSFKDQIIRSYPGVGYGTALELQSCPDRQKGWSMSEVKCYHKKTNFKIPMNFQKKYNEYYSKNYDLKKFYDDGIKIMLTSNPRVFSDSPTLKLETKETLYSHFLFYKGLIHNSLQKRND